jgi:hypothetical protein
MKSILKIVLLLCLTLTFVGCPSDDAPAPVPLRNAAEVYEEDIAKIEDFMLTHYVTVDADFNTTFTQIPPGGSQVPIKNMGALNSKEVVVKDITYKLYYLMLREGSGESPTRIDSAFVSYKGNTVTKTTEAGVDSYTQNVFDYSSTPVWFALEDVVRGWGEIIPRFKTGTYTPNADGTVSFQDFGAGVMFIPSGLGYFNAPTGSIDAYTPLIFNFKLYNLRFRDHDGDGILSKFEYGSNLYLPAIDTDGDGTPDYLDQDDDGDGFLTKFEIKKPLPLQAGQGTMERYPFDPILDDPLTPSINESEPKGIPDASGDGTNPTRLRRHLDKNAKPPYTTY